MDDAWPGMYQAIQPYQTRILHLHGDQGVPDAPLVCDLYSADVLHSTFGGLGLRGQLDGDECSLYDGEPCLIHSQRDSIVEFDALSYTWGNSGSSRHISCNDAPFPVTENLHEALLALRHRQGKHRFLWVDAICINQSDDKEKSEQVRNMFIIYQKAALVFAWLGPSHEYIDDVVAAAASVQSTCMFAINRKGDTEAKTQSPQTNVEGLTDVADVINVQLRQAQLKYDSRSLGPANAPLDAHPSFTIDHWKVYAGLKYLYTRPWFNRMWVQQEVYAARTLVFQCGRHHFEWDPILSDPGLLIRQSFANELRRTHPVAKWQRPEDQKKTKAMVVDLVRLQKAHLKCFELFHSPKHTISDADEQRLGRVLCMPRTDLSAPCRPDLIETLLNTGSLHTSNPRDHVYGLLGITGFPAKAMPLEDWLLARRSTGAYHIPIDYSTDLKSIFCAVTWIALMQGGLALVAKFKAFGPDAVASCEGLPSWVIDWPLASRLFRRLQPSDKWQGSDTIHLRDPTLAIQLGNAWYVRHFEPVPVLRPHAAPSEHVRFRNDNRTHDLPINKLMLRGTVDTRYFAEGRHVWEKRILGKAKRVWKVELDVFQEDLVVHLDAFVSGGMMLLSDVFMGNVHRTWNGGLWLLRPQGNDEFTLIACLSWLPNQNRTFYDHWAWSPHISQSQEADVGHIHQLSVDGPCKNWAEVSRYHKATKELGEPTKSRMFTIT